MELINIDDLKNLMVNANDDNKKYFEDLLSKLPTYQTNYINESSYGNDIVELVRNEENQSLNVHQGFMIKNRMSTGTGFDYVLGEKNTKYGKQFVTWVANDRGYDAGHYFTNLRSAQKDLIQRCANEMDVDLSVDHERKFILANIEDALYNCVDDIDRIRELMGDEEFMALAYNNYVNHEFITKVSDEINELVSDTVIDYQDEKLKQQGQER